MDEIVVSNSLRHFAVSFLVAFTLAAPLALGRAPEIAVKPLVSVDQLQPGQPFQLGLVIELRKPWHVNANPAAEGLIPTTLTVTAPAGVRLEAVRYPAGEVIRVEWATEPVALYSGRAILTVAGRVASDAPQGPVTFTGGLRYQACDDEVCFAPVELPVEWTAVIGDGLRAALPQHPEIFAAVAATAPPAEGLDALISERGWLLALVFLFFGGLALNLTPCVYPMVAITVSYFGGQGDKRIAVALARSLVYCLGIVLTYSLLGVVAALTGGLFGALLQSPAMLIGIAVLMVALALSMFGLFELRPPSFLVQQAAGLSSKAGWVGVFLLGATVGVIAAPCLAPILVALLAYVSQRADPWLGWWMFFTLALGLGAPYVVLGTFSGLLTRLPKSGTWMVWVKRVFGVLLLVVAGWFVSPLFGVASKSLIDWAPFTPAAIVAPGQPVLIDFYADWCIPCREMDRTAFADQRVADLAENFLTLKVDLTRSGAPEVDALIQQFGIVGMPTYIFLAPDGTEYRGLRKVGFVRVDEFLATMRAALAGSDIATPAAAGAPPPDIPPQLLNPF